MMLETIQQLKEDIAILQEKLQKLEELSQTKSPVEEAYKDWWGEYPTNTWQVDVSRWVAFQAGYNAAYEEKISEEPEENEWKLVALKLGENLSDNGPDGYYEFSADEWFEWAIDECLTNEVKRLQRKEWNAVRESVKWCEENPDKDPLDWLKPQTPEQTSQSLKEAFVEAQKTEKWKEIQKLIDEEDNDKNFKNSLDLIKEWGENNKPPTLYQLIEDWWCDVFCANSTDDMETCIDGLVDKIDKQFIPPSHNTNDYQWNKCLKMMRDKLR